MREPIEGGGGSGGRKPSRSSRIGQTWRIKSARGGSIEKGAERDKKGVVK